MKKNKGFLSIPIVIGLTIIAGVAAYLTYSRVKTTEPTWMPDPAPIPGKVSTTTKTPNVTKVQPTAPTSPKPTVSPSPTSAPSTTGTSPTATTGGSSNLTSYPDLQLTSALVEPLSVKFVVDHRSALNSKSITIRGVVVSTLLGDKACPPTMGMCSQPSVYIADTISVDRNKAYDLRVLVGESETESSYPVGSTVNIKVTVTGEKSSVIASRVY